MRANHHRNASRRVSAGAFPALTFSLVAQVLGTTGCLRFDDTTPLEGYCFNETVGRYQMCRDAALGIERPDADQVDSGAPRDASLGDRGTRDSGPRGDAMPVDTGVRDSGTATDATPVDGSIQDSGVYSDAGVPDMGSGDSGAHPDAMPVDAGSLDTGIPDSSTADTGSVPLHRLVEVRIAGSSIGVVQSVPAGIDCHYDPAVGQSDLSAHGDRLVLATF